jgi:hypothetical protein
VKIAAGISLAPRFEKIGVDRHKTKIYDDVIIYLSGAFSMRTIVDLPEDQIAALKQLSKQSKLSRAELMRRAVGEYLQNHSADAADDAFGIWQGQAPDGLAYQRQLREEWSE